MEEETTTGESFLKLYLNEHFNPSNGRSDGIAEEIIAHFWENYKVHVKVEKDLYLFKYAMSLCDSWDVPAINECRGIILRRGTESWTVMARPFNKFFNQNEGPSPVGQDPIFNPLCPEFVFLEKADGTCVQLWYDGDHNAEINPDQWRASTLGTITPDEWVTTLFWKLYSKDRLVPLTPSRTHLFELCCEQNKVVTSYETDRLFLIGVRDRETGEHFTFIELDALAKVIRVDRPKLFTFKELGIKTLKQAKEWVEKESLKSDYGKNPEGFVVYWKEKPLCKFKNESYVQKHGIVTGQILSVRNIIIDRFFAETLDDVADVLTNPIVVEFLAELKGKVVTLLHEATNERNRLLGLMDGQEMDKKILVDLIRKEANPRWVPFFLQSLNEIANKDMDVEGLAYQWMKKNYLKWKNTWKRTKVQALIDEELKINKCLPPEDAL
eukprot:TRINITY_DN10630_c0_g2_i1.p1 TRINITY_DN10630_c0_g2~~TRINITY_DN10630_c0_g2_i1.p1  ORF type:complete len:453 (+),score=104.05 TRINITY_DN10630_c0_g2_i1:43-1359(+)